MFVILNLYLANHLVALPPPSYFYCSTRWPLVLEIHNNWHEEDTFNHFSNLCSFQGIVLLVDLKNPLAYNSHHISYTCIFAARGVTTSPASGAENIIDQLLEAETQFWALIFIQKSKYVRILSLTHLSPTIAYRVAFSIKFFIHRWLNILAHAK